MKFGELAARFLAEGTPRPWHLDRLKLLLPFFSDCTLGGIHKGMVREYRAKRHRERKLTDTTINRDIEALRHILYWAVDEGFLSANPLARIRMERERRKPRPVLSLADEEKLLAASAPHLKPIIITALDTGMRRGELLQQRWEHVDFSRSLLFVTRSKTAEGESREIPLSARVSALLTTTRKPNGVVFTFHDQPLSRIKTAWKAALRRSKIRSLRFHDLRHTFNNRLMEAGVMQEIRKALMGHSSGEDVHATYVHVELPHKREAIAKLDRWLREQREDLNQGGTTAKEGDEKGNDRRTPETTAPVSPGSERVSAHEP